MSCPQSKDLQNRSFRSSCERCRMHKLKCVPKPGAQEGSPCARCLRARAECIFSPRAPAGRPKHRQRSRDEPRNQSHVPTQPQPNKTKPIDLPSSVSAPPPPPPSDLDMPVQTGHLLDATDWTSASPAFGDQVLPHAFPLDTTEMPDWASLGGGGGESMLEPYPTGPSDALKAFESVQHMHDFPSFPDPTPPPDMGPMMGGGMDAFGAWSGERQTSAFPGPFTPLGVGLSPAFETGGMTRKLSGLISDMQEFLGQIRTRQWAGVDAHDAHVPLENYPIGDILDFSRTFIDTVSGMRRRTRQDSVVESVYSADVDMFGGAEVSSWPSPGRSLGCSDADVPANVDLPEALLAIGCHITLTDIFRKAFADMHAFITRNAARVGSASPTDVAGRPTRGMYLDDLTAMSSTDTKVYTGIRILLDSSEAVERAMDSSALGSVAELEAQQRKASASSTSSTSTYSSDELASLDTPSDSTGSATSGRQSSSLLRDLSQAVAQLDAAKRPPGAAPGGSPNELQDIIRSVKRDLREKMRL